MSFEYLILIFVLLFVYKILILIWELNENRKKMWPLYFSSLVSEVTSLLGVYFILVGLIGSSFSEFIIFAIIGFFCIIENVILLIVGIICFIGQKKNIKDKELKNNNHALLKILFTFLIIYGGMFFIAYMPKMFKTETEKYIENYIENYAIEYMTTKYGDGNFEVVNIAKEYTGGLGNGTEYHSGYCVKIKTSYIDKIITIFIDGITEDDMEISYDSLIKDYYKVYDFYDFMQYLKVIKSKMLQDEYNKYFDVNIDVNCHYNERDDYGYIPTKDELIELCLVDTDHISINVNDYVEKENQLDYLKRLAKYSMNYFNNDDEVNIYYTLHDEKGFVKINSSTITIKIDNDEEIYSKEDIQNYTN